MDIRRPSQEADRRLGPTPPKEPMPTLRQGRFPQSPPAARPDVAVRTLTTLAIGGPCRWLADVRRAEEVGAWFRWARGEGIPVVFLGSGSNLLCADSGFDGLLLRSQIRGIEVSGEEVEVGGGTLLGDLIQELNARGLGGLERMYGIPGSVAGAVVGNAGAYGQEIADRLVEVDFWDADGLRTLPAAELDLRYRHSRFKERLDWFVVRCRLKFHPGQSDLAAESRRILELRTQKYPPDLKCPGSFFKNLVWEEISDEAKGRFPAGFLYFGKVPAGKLLEEVGAKGERQGAARVADYHGNLFINDGGASARDLLELARRLAARVHERFCVTLEPEIRILEGPQSANIRG